MLYGTPKSNLNKFNNTVLANQRFSFAACDICRLTSDFVTNLTASEENSRLIFKHAFLDDRREPIYSYIVASAYCIVFLLISCYLGYKSFKFYFVIIILNKDIKTFIL